MKDNHGQTYRKAGVAKRRGNGIILEFPEDRYYLTGEDTALLMGNKPVSIIDGAGELFGCAWLSPIRELKKRDVVASIHDRIYVMNLAETKRLLGGRVHVISLSEYLTKTTAA